MIFIALLLIGAMVLDTANTSNSVIEPHVEATSQVKIDRGDQRK
jgi:hypothetical protein